MTDTTLWIAVYLLGVFITFVIVCRYVLEGEVDQEHIAFSLFWPVMVLMLIALCILEAINFVLNKFAVLCRWGKK